MSRTELKQLGELELKLMRYLATGSGKSVREVSDDFGNENGYALTTILTVMDRLHAKGYLTKKKTSGINVFTSRLSQKDLMKGVVNGFVSNALEGSLSPLFLYIAEGRPLSDSELTELKALVETLENKEEDDD